MTACAAVIPARFGSTRLPGKPLLCDTGKPLIRHVYERVAAARRIGRALVATDDLRIFEAVRAFGGEAVMTSPDHASGSDRVAEAARNLSEEIIINVQGDEPEIPPDLLDGLVDLLEKFPDARIATAAAPIRESAEFASPNVVKAVVGGDGRALYFSRSPVPHGAWIGGDAPPLKHIGVYAFRRQALLRFAALPPVPIERAEKLEQLRALHHGFEMRVLLAESGHPGIDTREDYDAFVSRYHGERESASP